MEYSHRGIIRGNKGPGPEKWGTFMRALLGASDQKVGSSIHEGRGRKKGSLHRVIVVGQGKESGATSWGHYWSENWGPFIGSFPFGEEGSEKWGHFIGTLLEARVRKVGPFMHGVIFGLISRSSCIFFSPDIETG